MKRLLLIALLLAACGGAPRPTVTPTTPATPSAVATPTAPPLTLAEIRDADYGAVTLDLFHHTDTIQARFVDAVYDEPFEGTVLGLFIPLGISDKSLLVYAMDSCAGTAELPVDWEPAPGQTAPDMAAFAREVRRLAQSLLCPHL